MLHPDPDEHELRALLAEHSRQDGAEAARRPTVDAQAVAEVVRSGWESRPPGGAVTRPSRTPSGRGGRRCSAARRSSRCAYAVRTLLMHGYWRARLRDPLPPDELMPHDWLGAAARALCRNLYRHRRGRRRKFMCRRCCTFRRGLAPDAGARLLRPLRRPGAAALPQLPGSHRLSTGRRTAAPPHQVDRDEGHGVGPDARQRDVARDRVDDEDVRPPAGRSCRR